MDLATFYEQFQLLADAPNGIQKLREMILQLAVQGKLVPQDPNDEPASVLLDKIKAEKARLVRDGEVTRPCKTQPINESTLPFEVPRNWCWVRIGAAIHLVNGRAFKPADWSSEGIPIVRIQNLNNPDAAYNYCAFEVKDKFLIDNGEFLISWSGTPGTSFGAFIWRRGRAVLNQHIFKGVLYGEWMAKRYLQLAINARLDEMIAQAHGGVGLRHITKGKLEAIELPLPPLAEQHRIVAKVDELMALCDELEERQTQQVEVRGKANVAALDGLLRATDADDFARHWQRICDHFDILYDAPDNVAELRKAILQLAVQGKLVPQDPNDEPASVLLEKITAEKARLVKKGKLKKQKPLPPIDPDDVPFEVPDGWEWVRVGTVADVRGGVTLGRKLGGDSTCLMPYLRVANVQEGYVDLSQVKKVEVKEAEVEKYRLQVGDVLLTEGGDWDKLGRSAIWHGQIPECLHQNHVFRARPERTALSGRWLSTFTNSASGRAYFQSASKQTTNLASINMTQLKNCPVPVPPISEQRRVMARVDELMALCDELESGLRDGLEKRERLAVAMAGAVG